VPAFPKRWPGRLELNPAGRLGLDPPVRRQLNGHPTDRSAY
jgi:hypothetical protein